ncbi:hypothetical protein CEQ90_09005 [Lewinellaceae bacterium SD302]|nr:hypothetical protein CEQ90_09005 [Lewinellaceae bacterium SD302]
MQKVTSASHELVELFPRGRSDNFLARSGWRRLGEYRFLIRQLVRINFNTEFKRSFIGLSWLLILPLLSVAIWILLNGAGIVDPGATAVPYPAYVLLSTSIWGFFADIYKNSSNLVTNYGRMLIMTPFPYGVLLAEQVVVHLIRFSIPFGLNLIVLLFFGVEFTWWALLFPLSLIPLLLLGLAIGLIVALLRIVAVDLSKLADEGIRLLMFLTPIVYTPKIELGWLSELVKINPLTYLVSFSRDLLTEGTFYAPVTYLAVSGFSLVFFALAVRIYAKSQPRILERLIAA